MQISKSLKDDLERRYESERVAAVVSQFSEGDRRKFFSSLFALMAEPELARTHDMLSRAVYKDRWKVFEKWMDAALTKDMKKTPRVIAEMALNYHKIDKRMLPLFIKLAQKVKARVGMRRFRKSSDWQVF